MPPGALWVPETDAGLDQLLDGISENSEETRIFLASLAFLRNASLTPILSDMEKEYGLLQNTSLTEQERRNRLRAAMTDRFGFGADYMESKLQAAGFDVQVHINNPVVDPDQFLFEAFKCPAAKTTSVAGNTNAVAGGLGGELVVNGDLYDANSPPRELIDYTIPADPGYWGLFFFIGGDATRDVVTDELLTIDPALLSISRREEIRGLIVKYKPLHSWAGLIVNYV
jgi:hypothetical protein